MANTGEYHEPKREERRGCGRRALQVKCTMVVVAAALHLGIPAASAQGETAGTCFCDAGGAIGVSQLIRAVNVALGSADCPSSALAANTTSALGTAQSEPAGVRWISWRGWRRWCRGRG